MSYFDGKSHSENQVIDMTPTEKLKEIVESIDGMCWHEYDFEHPAPNRVYCDSCGLLLMSSDSGMMLTVNDNPSPDDLNALFDLSEKMGFKDVSISGTNEWYHATLRRSVVCKLKLVRYGQSRSEALLEALWKAAKGNKE
jgi:hypothetical protein